MRSDIVTSNCCVEQDLNRRSVKRIVEGRVVEPAPGAQIEYAFCKPKGGFMKRTSQVSFAVLAIVFGMLAVACTTEKSVYMPAPQGPKAPSQNGAASPTTHLQAGATVSTPAQGPNSDGGGNVVKGKVLDLVEDAGLIEFDPLNHPEASATLAKRLLDLNDRIRFMRADIWSPFGGSPLRILSAAPENTKILAQTCYEHGYTATDLRRCMGAVISGYGLGDVLRAQLPTRRWYLEKNEIVSEGCTNKSMIKLKSRIAACQDDFEVRISQPAWNNLDDEGKDALITHELFLTAFRANKELYEKNKQVFERSVRVLNALVYAPGSEQRLAAELEQRADGVASFKMQPFFLSPVYGNGLKIVDSLMSEIKTLACKNAGRPDDLFSAELIDYVYHKAGIFKPTTKNFSDAAAVRMATFVKENGTTPISWLSSVMSSTPYSAPWGQYNKKIFVTDVSGFLTPPSLVCESIKIIESL